MEEKPKFQLPGVGLRNLKTAFSAALCAAAAAFWWVWRKLTR